MQKVNTLHVSLSQVISEICSDRSVFSYNYKHHVHKSSNSFTCSAVCVVGWGLWCVCVCVCARELRIVSKNKEFVL